MNKEIEKYVCYYLSVYIVVLFIYGFFEYIAVCNGESLKCAFDGMKIKEALTITASVFTPVIAIFAYFSWKEQKKYDLKKEFLAKCLNDIDEIYSEKLSILLKLEVLRTISNEKAVLLLLLIRSITFMLFIYLGGQMYIKNSYVCLPNMLIVYVV